MLQINIELRPGRFTCACTKVHIIKFPINEQNFVLNGRLPSRVMEWKITLMARQALAEGLWKEDLHSLCPPSSFSEPLDSRHFSISSIVQNNWGRKGKHWALNCSLVPRGYNIQSEEELHFFQTYMSFLKQPATPTFTWHLLEAHSLREGNWISEAAEVAAALLSLPALYSVFCHGKIWEHRICNELLQ